jgi:hypothetical protein
MSEIEPRNRAERRAAEKQNRKRGAAAAIAATKVGAMVATTAAAAFVTGVGPAGAAVACNANSTGTLATAIDNANAANCTDNTINIAAGADISVANGDLNAITAPVSIVGAGPDSSTLTGVGTDSRIFYIDASSSTFDVTISGLTLTHDNTTFDGDGGAILNRSGHLKLTNDVVTGNHVTGAGGGVASLDNNNMLVLDGTTVSDNEADGSISSDAGGGVYVSGQSAELDVMNSTVTGNHSGLWGGGLYFYGGGGVVNVTNSTISDNTAESGGGGGWLGGQHNATTTIQSSTISGNHALGNDAGGMGLYTENVSISDTTVSDNDSEGRGGGLYFERNDVGVTIDNSTITNNESTDSTGGGISFYSMYAPATITNTTISGNTAAEGGGGVYATGGEADSTGAISVYNSTISGNHALDGSGGGFYISFVEAPFSIYNSTISGNDSTADGGGIAFRGYYGLNLVQTTITDNSSSADVGGLYLQDVSDVAQAEHAARISAQSEGGKPGHRNENGGAHASQVTKFPVFSETSSVGTIIAGNVGTDVGNGSIVDSDHSLFGSVASGTTINDLGGTQIGADPKLGPLADNGGPTQTHALLTGSPAIDASTNPVASFTGNAYDQRGPGFARVVNGVADIGAFEVQPPPAPPAPEPLAPEAVVITPKFTG